MWLLGEFYILFAELIDIKEGIFTSPGVCEGFPKMILFSLFVPLVFFIFSPSAALNSVFDTIHTLSCDTGVFSEP